MASQYGTLSILDTLAANKTLLAEYGQDRAYADVEILLNEYNAVTGEMTADLVEYTSDRLRRYGGAAVGTMEEADEFGRPDVQKLTQGVNVGFPLALYQYGIGWTRKYFQTKTVSEWAAQIQGAMIAHSARVQRQIKRAIFTPTNNTGYLDRLVDNLNVPLRAFTNADGTEIPPDPYGNTFNFATHTHYLGTSSFVAADLSALVNTVVEHYNMGTIVVDINQAQEAAVRAFTGFNAYVDTRVVQPYTSSYADFRPLELMSLYNRAIGVYGAAEIWIRPWIPSGYIFAFNPGVRKPLAFRTRSGAFGGLQIAAMLEEYPLYAEYFEDEFGCAVQERTNGAALDTGHSTYTAPTIS